LRSADDKRPGAGEEHARRRAGTTRARETQDGRRSRRDVRGAA
jgi:hypothetical protein